jgi:purine-binding chemotaxis protein CheW
MTSDAGAAVMDEHETKTGETWMQYVSCRVGDEELGIDILNVQEIIPIIDVTPVPKAPASVEGVINLRGRIIPVLDLRRRFGLPAIERSPHARIVLVTVKGRAVGLIVDAVSEVQRVRQSVIEPAPSLGSGPSAEYVQGIGRLDDHLLVIIDLLRLLTPDSQLAQAGAA